MSAADTAFSVRLDPVEEDHQVDVLALRYLAKRGGEPVRLLARAPDDAFVAVMTHSHALDLDLVAAALGSKRFSYVGLIGSATKRARFVGAMRKLGIPADAIERLTCPIGLTEIRDKAPATIAAAIVAQLLIVRETMARPMTRDERGHARADPRRTNDA